MNTSPLTNLVQTKLADDTYSARPKQHHQSSYAIDDLLGTLDIGGLEEDSRQATEANEAVCALKNLIAFASKTLPRT